jgi:hypothetical protein
MHTDLENAAPAQRPAAHADLIWVLDDAPHQVLEGLLKHVRPQSLRQR